MQNVIAETETKMKKAIDALKKDLTGIRTGRANPALLDHIKVNYYGADVPLKQIASIGVPEPRMMVITPFDKSAAAEISKAIQASDLGINPQQDGGGIRLVLPEPSEERRKELVKVIKKEGEQSKVSLRNIRREARENKSLTEDDLKTMDKKIQEITDKYSKEIDSLLASKEKEIMEV